jgi:CRP-like cAMP-binding protein
MIVGAIFEIIFFLMVGDEQLIVTLIYCSVWILVNSYELFLLLREKWSLKFNERELLIYNLSFTALSRINFRKLLDIAKWNKVDAGFVLIEEHAIIDNLMYITNGVAEVESKNKITAYLSDGNFAGEMSFISKELTTAKVTAITPVEYLVWSREELNKLILKSKEIEEGLSTVFNHDLVKKLSNMMAKENESNVELDLQKPII